MIRNSIRWLQNLARQHEWVNGLFHGLGVLLIMLPFWLLGYPRLGAGWGASIYLWREAEDVFSRWTKSGGTFKVTKDNLVDLSGPAVVFVLAMVLL